MPKEVIIPALGESITSGILSSWKVEEGSYVELDQPIYELETDKITQEGLADASGVIKFLAKEGEEVEIGATIATIDESAESPSVPTPPLKKKKLIVSSTVKETAPEPQENSPTAPSRREKGPAPEPVAVPIQIVNQQPILQQFESFLDETGIDPSIIKGTGKDGRIDQRAMCSMHKIKRPSLYCLQKVDISPSPAPASKAEFG